MYKFGIGRFFSVVMVLVFVLGMVAQAVLPVPVLADDPVVIFPDTKLDTAIREAISKPTGDILASDLAGLTTLNADNRGIINLSGLEYCTSLTTLHVCLNQISDITPLAGLTNLTVLWLGQNQISDLTPLAGLTNLTELWLQINQISDLTPLAGLTNLTKLALNQNQISDLTPLAGLTNLTELWLGFNQISDLTPLTGLTSLTGLDLYGTQISDLTLLAGLTNLTVLWLGQNQISDLTPLAGLTNLTVLGLMVNQISDLTPLAGLTNLTELLLNINQISDLTPLAGLTNLTELWLHNNHITDLSPLAGLTMLTHLSLWGNQISELAPLAGLTNLTELYLNYNSIRDLAPLAGLTNLTKLWLDNNYISDISALVNNVGLATGDLLYLRSNPLNLASINVHIPTLQARGVIVSWDTQAPAVTTGTARYTSPTWFYFTGDLTGLGNADTSVTPYIEYWGPANGTWTLASMTSEGPFNAPTTLQTPPGAMPAGTYTFRAKAQGDQSGTWAYGDNATFIFQPSQPYTITTSTNTGTLTLQSNLGNITSLSAISIQTLPNWPPLIVFPHGLMYCEVSNIEAGATVTFTITFPVTLPANIQYWKYQPGIGWFQIPITSHNGNVITIQITDGGLGDADGLVNGIIIDPGGVAVIDPSIGTGAPTSHGSSVTALPPQSPVALSNIYVQSASLSTSKVAPGTPVTVTANIANRGTVNGSARIKLYVNGEEDSSQGITVESGGNRPVYFTVSRSQPGTYNIYVGGRQAGSFMVEDAVDPNIILYISLSMICLAFVLGAVMIARRNSYY